MTTDDPEDYPFFAGVGVTKQTHEAMLQQAARIAGLGYFVFDVIRNRIDVCSWRHAQIFGREPREYVETATGFAGNMTMVHHDDVDMIRQKYDELRRGQPIEMEYRFLHKNGSIGHVREFVAPGYDDVGRVVRGFGSSLDITDQFRKNELDWRRRRVSAIGEMTTGIAHDFNNLLTVMRGNAELAAIAHRKVDLDQSLDEILTAADRGKATIDSLLSFSQRARVSPEPVDLEKEIRNVIATFNGNTALPKGAQMDLRTSKVCAHVDRSQLRLTLNQLLHNAEDAMPDGGHLDVVLRRYAVSDDTTDHSEADLKPGQYIEIVVKDGGVGISSLVLPRVTDPFFTTKSRAKGSGLGLSMAVGFAKQSGGGLLVESEQDEGTTVRLFLPQAETPIRGEDVTIAKPSEALKSSIKVLLLDDDPMIAKVVGRQIRALSHEIHVVHTAQDALDAAQEITFDLAVFDQVLAGIERGSDVARNLRKTQPKLPLILMSGISEFLDPEEQIVFDAMLTKPATREEIQKAIDKCLGV